MSGSKPELVSEQDIWHRRLNLLVNLTFHGIFLDSGGLSFAEALRGRAY